MTVRVYIAAPRTQANVADDLAMALADMGIRAVSRWHQSGPFEDDPTDPQEAITVLTGNLWDLCSANVVLALTAQGQPRATNCEIGYAIAKGIPVVWVSGEKGEGANLFDRHQLVTALRFGSASTQAIASLIRGVASQGV